MDKGRQLQTLTTLPKSFSIHQIEKIFRTSNRMARKAKKLIEMDEFMKSPMTKIRAGLSVGTKNLVKNFYKDDKNSRIMPGKRDYKTVIIENGEKIKEQKRLLLCNLKELFQLFKDTFPDASIGFSKFVELQLQECVLIGGNGIFINKF